MDCGVVIPAAGLGRRMNTDTKKQYIKLASRPIIVHTLKIFIEIFSFSEIVLTVRKEDIPFCRENILDKYNISAVKLVPGGQTRRESVFKGLQSFSQSPEYVIIHDGSRPLLPSGVLREKLLPAMQNYRAVTTGVDVKDTIKIRTEDGFVKKTPPRDKLVAIQTPQGFHYKLLMKAHHRVPEDIKASDDASLVEYIDEKVKIVEGSYENIKVTTPDDLELARLILEKRGDNH